MNNILIRKQKTPCSEAFALRAIGRQQRQFVPTLMKRKFPSFGGVRGGFILLFLILFLSIGYGNNKEYYENLLKSAQEEEDLRNYAKAMKDLMQVKMYAKDNQLYSMEATALNAMGIIYKNMLSCNKAIECYLEAYQIASKLPDKKHEIILLNNIGGLYSFSNNMDKAEEYFEKACQMAMARNDNYKVMQLLHNLIAVSNQKGNLEQAEKYLRIAMERMKQYPEDPHIIYIKSVKAEYLYFKKEYDSAEQLALKVLSQSKELLPQSEADCLILLSKIYNQKKNYPQAIAYAKDALQLNVNMQMVIEIYEQLSAIYRTTHSPSLAWQYEDSARIMKDSLLQLNSVSQILRGQVQFDLNNMEKKLTENKAKQKQERLVFMLSLAFLLIIAVMFVWILRVRLTKNKQLKVIAELKLDKEEKENLLLEQQVKERETMALLEYRMYKNEIELKNKQLVSNTLFQSSKNKLLEDIIHTLSKISNQMEKSELHPIIQQLQSQIKEPASADWNSFLTYFEQTNPAFLITLKKKHPDLTANEMRLASYIYLNLDTKEISRLLHITPDHCKRKKQRLAQKLEIPSIKLYSYLTGLF